MAINRKPFLDRNGVACDKNKWLAEAKSSFVLKKGERVKNAGEEYFVHSRYTGVHKEGAYEVTVDRIGGPLKDDPYHGHRELFTTEAAAETEHDRIKAAISKGASLARA